MRNIFWLKYLLLALVFTPVVAVNKMSVAGAAPLEIAQGTPAYSRYMKLGYQATKSRNYTVALNYFKLALKDRPGDQYASTAVRNIEGYVARDRRIVRQRRYGLSFVPANIGIPNRRITAASRGAECIAKNTKSLTALIPEKDAVVTAANYPKMFFYVPENSAESLEFVLQDENESDLYKLTFKKNERPGIIDVSIPANANLPPLQVGKQYHWTFAVVCDSADEESNVVVKGTLQRVALEQNMSSELAKAKPEERAALYAASGLWPDTLATLAQLRRQNPTDSALKSDWEELLKSVGLDAIAKEPLVTCCTVKN